MGRGCSSAWSWQAIFTNREFQLPEYCSMLPPQRLTASACRQGQLSGLFGVGLDGQLMLLCFYQHGSSAGCLVQLQQLFPPFGVDCMGVWGGADGRARGSGHGWPWPCEAITAGAPSQVLFNPLLK